MKVHKLEKAERTFFFEREDGTIFFTKEKEAWNIVNGRNQVAGVRSIKPKLIGCSDGSLFMKAVAEAQSVFTLQGIEKAQEIIRKGEKDELEVARGNIVRPRNFDTVGQGGVPVNINNFR